jgi:hypothetical protein
MPIRTAPFAAIDVALVRDMITREIREDRTLDFKAQLNLDSAGKITDKIEIAKDVTAMANASGGTILYGAVEGNAVDAGRVIEIRGMRIEPDLVQSQITNLLRDWIEERIPDVEHQAIPVGDGTYLYVIRIPPSPRAPHIIKNQRSLYMRATTSNDPMSASQMREMVLRAETAYERARARIEQRIDEIKRYVHKRYDAINSRNPAVSASVDFLAFHAIPLLPQINAIDFASRELVHKWQQSVPPFGAEAGGYQVRPSFDGLRSQQSEMQGFTDGWTMLLRTGGIEGVAIGNAYGRGAGGAGKMSGRRIEVMTLAGLDQVRKLADDGFLSAPFALSLQLHGLYGLTAVAGEEFIIDPRIIDRDSVPIEPVIINRWEEVPDAIRSMFHVMWQSWGFARSPFYDDQGARRQRVRG